MNCHEFESMMIDALGGELRESDRPLFEEHLASCGCCRADIESARAAVHALRELPAVSEEVNRVTAFSTPAQGIGRRSTEKFRNIRSGVFWRQAAGIVLAFMVGYYSRPLSPTKPESADSLPTPDIARTFEFAPSSFAAALRNTYRKHPNRSDLANCLAAAFGGKR